MGGECFGRVAEADGSGAVFYVLGEGDILEDAFAYGAMAADGEVGFAFDQQKLAVGRGEATGWVVDLLGRVDGGQLGEDERHDGVLPEAGDDLARRVGEQRDLMAIGFAEGAGDVVGFVDGVCVGEEEILAACCLCAGPAGVVLAGESSVDGEVELRGVENVDSCVARGCFGGDVARVVGGVVVDDDKFPLMIEEETWLRLGENGGQTCGQRTLLVAGWNDDREFEVGCFV